MIQSFEVLKDFKSFGWLKIGKHPIFLYGLCILTGAFGFAPEVWSRSESAPIHYYLRHPYCPGQKSKFSLLNDSLNNIFSFLKKPEKQKVDFTVLNAADAEANRIKSNLNDQMVSLSNDDGEPGPRFFMINFAYEGQGQFAADSHTFASYIRVDPGQEPKWNDISWLPASFVEKQEISVFKNYAMAAYYEMVGQPFTPEKGTNLSVDATLKFAIETKKRVAIWGPSEITEDMYNTGLRRINHLNSGKVKYIADDREFQREGDAINCMHAISDVEGTRMARGGILKTGLDNWGVNGTESVVRHLTSMGGSLWFKSHVNPLIRQDLQ